MGLFTYFLLSVPSVPRFIFISTNIMVLKISIGVTGSIIFISMNILDFRLNIGMTISTFISMIIKAFKVSIHV